MLSSNQSKNEMDYSLFGGTKSDDEIIQEETPIEENKLIQQDAPSQEKPSPDIKEKEKVDYSQFGGKQSEPPREKVGKFKSTLLGLYEGVLTLPALSQYAAQELVAKGVELVTGEPFSLPEEHKSRLLKHLSKLPESEDEAARRFRVAGQVTPLAALGGIPGLISAWLGSQAGQTVREIYGEEGKFKEFGWGEAAAIGADLVTGLGAGIAQSLARSTARTAATDIPSIFRNAETGLQRKVTQIAIQQEENALKEVIDNFSQTQIKSFEEAAVNISPQPFTNFTESNVSVVKREADSMFRNTQLSIISPLEATTEQAGSMIQDVANLTFKNEVLMAESSAYKAASKASKGLTGQAPKTLEEAKSLRSKLTQVEPTPEQKPIIAFLNVLIEDLETTTPSSVTPASKILDAKGNPLVAAVKNESTTEATKRTANELVEMVQKANQVVNYGGEVREQSHRLIPLLKTFRTEVGEVLSQNPAAAKLYQEANLLHGRNAEVWGTKYMRSVRFAENPEQIISNTKKASNLRNFKQGIQEPTIQGVAERAIVEQITEGGKVNSNRNVIKNISPELSPVAQEAAENLINVKDPLTTTGGRAAVRNSILAEAAMSVNTGKRPEKIIDLMNTTKGYQIVRETFKGNPESIELFKSFERLFMEDIVSSVTDSSGHIDFTKAKQIFKTPETRQVVEQIGGESLVRRFQQLETFSNNLQKNIDLYSRSETQSIFKSIAKEVKDVGILTAVLNSLHMPWSVISGLGIAKTGGKLIKFGYKELEKKILSNPRAVHYLEKVSQATTPKELAKHLPRLMAELEKPEN